MFDTHQFVKDMTGAKMPKAQAEMLGKALLDSRTNTATKGDIAGATELTDKKFETMQVQFDYLRDRMDIKADSAVNSALVRFVFVQIAIVSVAIAVLQYFNPVLQYLNQGG